MAVWVRRVGADLCASDNPESGHQTYPQIAAGQLPEISYRIPTIGLHPKVVVEHLEAASEDRKGNADVLGEGGQDVDRVAEAFSMSLIYSWLT